LFVRDSLGATQSSLLRNTDKLSLSVPPVRAAMQLTLGTSESYPRINDKVQHIGDKCPNEYQHR
jgi:hypothetical protein